MAGLLIAAAAVLGLLRSPRGGFFLVLVLGSSVLQFGSLVFTAGGVQSDAVEALSYGLMAVWAFEYLRGRVRIESPFAVAAVVLVCAVAAGTLVGFARGSTFHDMLGYIKGWLTYALVVPIASWFATREDRDLLERWVIGICVVGGVIALVVGFSGATVGFIGIRPYDVVTLGSTAENIQRIRPDLVALLVLATLLVAARVVHSGLSAGRAAVLALFGLLHAVSFTRSTWVPLIIALGVLGVAHPGPRRHLRGLRVALGAVLISASLLVAAGAGALGPTAEAFAFRLSSVTDPAVLREDSYSDRESENASAIATLRANPLTGVGVAQFYGARRPVYLPNPPRIVFVDRFTLHNQYLFVWLQLGSIGMVALGALAVAVVRTARVVRRIVPEDDAARCFAAALAVFCVGLQATFQTIVLYPAHVLAMVCALVLAAPPRDVANTEMQADPQARVAPSPSHSRRSASR